MTCPLGVYSRPFYGYNYNSAQGTVLDGMFTTNSGGSTPIYNDIFGDLPIGSDPGLPSLACQPELMMAFFSWAGNYSGTSQPSRTDTATGIATSSSITDSSISGADLGRNVTGTHIPTGSYVGAMVPGASFTLVNSGGAAVLPTGAVSSITLAADTSIQTSNVRWVLFDDEPCYQTQNAQVTYYDFQNGITTFTNRTDTSGTGGTNGNPNNLGIKRWCDWVRDQCPGSTAVFTWRCGAVDNTNNMENSSAWQQEFHPYAVLTGSQDGFIKVFAAQMANWIAQNPQTPLECRLPQEMNGNNYGWAMNQQWVNPAMPLNGPLLVNCFNQSATSGNPIATTGGSSGIGGYGYFGGYFRYVSGMLKQQIVATLMVTWGMTKAAAVALCASNFQTIWCEGSGNTFPIVSGAPKCGNQTSQARPFVEIGAAFNGSSTISMNSATVSTSGGVTTVVLDPAHAFPQTTAGPVGHCFPQGSTVIFATTGGGLDTHTYKLTQIGLQTLTFASTVTGYTATGGTVAINAPTTYVQNAAPYMGFYPGDDNEPNTGLPYVDIVSMDGYNGQHTGTNWKSINSIFSGIYSVLSVGCKSGAPVMQVTENACIENPVNNGADLQTIPDTWTTGQGWNFGDNCVYAGNIYQCINPSGLTNDTVIPPSDTGNWGFQFAGIADGVITTTTKLTSQLVTVYGTGLVGLEISGANVPANTFITAVNTATNVATLSQPCTNGQALSLACSFPSFADGTITVSGGGTTVKIASTSIYPMSTIGTSVSSWVVSGGGLAYNYVASVSAGSATLIFPNGGGPTVNGTTAAALTLTPPTKGDWLAVNYSSNSNQSWGVLFPLVTGGVIYFDHDSVKFTGTTTFTGTYNVRDTPAALAVWQGLATDTWFTNARLLPVYPGADNISLNWG